mgnify:FL=1
MTEVLTTYSFDLSFERTHDTDAEIAGLRLMTRAGVHPQASFDVWKKCRRKKIVLVQNS